MSYKDMNLMGWHLKKEVTIGQIITLLTILLSGLWWASSVETRLADGVSNDRRIEAERIAEDRRIEQKTDIILKGMSDRFDRSQDAVSVAFEKIDDSLVRIEKKLDRKADRQ